MAASVLHRPPDRISRDDVLVMEQSAADELPAIQALWSSFERLVGLRGRKMYARVDEAAHTYTACTPIKADDRHDQLGLQVGTLPGGRYLRGRLIGEPPQVYDLIGDGMRELVAQADLDESRPLVEFYRRHDEIELWVPIRS
jgi:hypothetical protein